MSCRKGIRHVREWAWPDLPGEQAPHDVLREADCASRKSPFRVPYRETRKLARCPRPPPRRCLSLAHVVRAKPLHITTSVVVRTREQPVFAPRGTQHFRSSLHSSLGLFVYADCHEQRFSPSPLTSFRFRCFSGQSSNTSVTRRVNIAARLLLPRLLTISCKPRFAETRPFTFLEKTPEPESSRAAGLCEAGHRLLRRVVEKTSCVRPNQGSISFREYSCRLALPCYS